MKIVNYSEGVIIHYQLSIIHYPQYNKLFSIPIDLKQALKIKNVPREWELLSLE